MKPRLDFKKIALDLLNRYNQYLTYDDYEDITSHTEAKHILLKLSEICHILKNLSHFFEVKSVETLACELENTISLCLSKKIKQYFKKVNEIQFVFIYLSEMLIQFDENTDSDQISPEIQDLINQLKKVQNISENPVEESVTEKRSHYSNEFKIMIQPSENVFSTGLDIIAVLDELRKLGKAEISPLLENIPDLDNINPEKCYVGFEILLQTDADTNGVKDALIFLDYDEGSKVSLDLISHNNETAENRNIASEEIAQVPLTATEKEKKTGLPDATEEQPKLPSVEMQVNPESMSTIRVAASKLDSIVNLVGEIVTTQSRLEQISARTTNAELGSISEEMGRLTNELRIQSMGLRMLPVMVLFKRFSRLVHDLSQDLRKEIEISFEGEETELDKSVIEKLNDPLVHLIRNSIDHGIETPEVRKQKGKPETGHIVLSAFQSGPEVIVQIRDDGAGVNLGKVRRKAIEKGIIQDSDKLTEKDILQLIFAPGFSTAENVSDVSGRGVGMDVVKSNIESLRGSVDVSTANNSGTTISLRLPLTMAIIDGLLVEVGDEHFVMPLSVVEECLEYKATQVQENQHRNIINLREKPVPFVQMNRFFNIEDNDKTAEKMVIIRNESDEMVGLVVNRIIGQHQTVIKPLGMLYKERAEFSGATILGDGSIALILDPVKLIQSIMKGSEANQAKE